MREGAPAPELEEGEELIAGRRPVEEAFTAGRPPRRLLVTPQRRQALERIVLHATTLRIPIVEVEGGSLTALAGFDGHQGVAVVVEKRRFASVDEILARSIERGEAPFVLVLDSLEDPQNVGTLLRSAEAAGVDGVIFPTERQAPLSPAAIKASSGATEHLLLAAVDDLPGALTDLHLRGLRIVGSDAEAALTAREADLRGPTAIVVGSEGHGLSPAIRRRCDLFVRIPMRGAIGSLNAAVAGSVLLFETLGQRDPGARPAAGSSPSGPLQDRVSPTTPKRGGKPRSVVPPTPDVVSEASPDDAPDDQVEPALTELLPEAPVQPAAPAPAKPKRATSRKPETTPPAEAPSRARRTRSAGPPPEPPTAEASTDIPPPARSKRAARPKPASTPAESPADASAEASQPARAKRSTARTEPEAPPPSKAKRGATVPAEEPPPARPKRATKGSGA